jgi:hypothetical protein
MGTKNNPAPFDCVANAEPDEPMFTLLGRDATAAAALRAWVALRLAGGYNEAGDAQITEALACAAAMEAWALSKGKDPSRASTEVVNRLSVHVARAHDPSDAAFCVLADLFDHGEVPQK